MRLIFFLVFCCGVLFKAFRDGPIYLVLLLTFMYFVYPEKYIWGIEDYRIVLILNLVLLLHTWIWYGRIDLFNDLYSKLMLGLLFVYFLSSQMALVDDSSAMGETELFLKLIIYFLILKTILTDLRSVRLFYQGCLISLTLLSAWGIQQYILGNIRLEDFGGGQIAGSNQLASALVWGMPIGFFFTYCARTVWEKCGYWLSLAIMFTGIICTESRQAFLAILFYGAYLFVSSKRKFLYAITLCIIVIVGIGFVPDAYWERMNTITNYEEDASATGRLQIWGVAYHLWKENPVMGIGPGNFRLVSPEYFGKVRVTHNTYFQILSELGLAGAVLFYLIMMFTLILLGRLIGMYRDDEYNTDIFAFASMARMGLLGLLICCIFQNKASHEFLYFSTAVGAGLRQYRYNIPQRG